VFTAPRPWIAAIAVIVAVAASPPARADSKNEVRAVTFDEDNGITRVHVRGAQTPTFTVYKLERPSRVVIDLPQARLAEALRGHESAAVLTPSTWAVSTIAAQQLDDGAVRVIVTLARPGRYDVKTEGNELVVMVMPRDPAPKMASPEDLARAQAESEQARQQARAAEAARADAEKTTVAAQAEAERLRKLAADQAARAEAAQRAADEARVAQQKATTNAADVEHAKATTAKAQAEAARAKAEAAQASELAAKAQAEADQIRASADQTRRDAAAETQKAREELARAQAAQQKSHDDMMRAQEQAEAAQAAQQKSRDDMKRAQQQAEAAQAAQQKSHDDMMRAQQQAEAAQAAQQKSHDEMMRAQQQAEAAQAQAQAARQEADRIKREADAKRADTETAKKADAERAKQEVARALAQADAAKREAERAMHDAETRRAEAEAAKRDAEARTAEAEAARRELAKTSQQSRAEADAARADAAREKAEVEQARREMAQTAQETRAQAEAAKAEAAREKADAEKLMKEAKVKLAAIDKRASEAQQIEDRARAASAAAEAREDAARQTEAKTLHERELAEAAAKQAQQARDSAAASDRAKLAADAHAAEERLAQARQATTDAESRREAAEQAAKVARQDLEQTKTTLASVEQQRATTEAAATTAARKRSEAEAAAADATRRRSEAEVAAAEATKKRTEAEAQASAADAARAAADKQRDVALESARTAIATRKQAEASLAELTARREAAERAAADVDARARAEAKAQADVAAAKARKASDDELATARAEVARLAGERKHAEDELGERRKAVAMQQDQVAKLQTTAAQAKDAADREEARRLALSHQREAEEQQLAAIEKKKAAAAAAAAAPSPAPTPPPVVAARTPKPETRSVKADVPAPVAKVQNVTFHGDPASGQVDIALQGDAEVHLGEVTAQHVELIVEHAQLAPKLERTLDVSRFGSPIRNVSSFRDRRLPDRVRLIAELAQPATPTLEHDATGVHWRFASMDKVAHAPSAPPPVIGGFGAASTPIAQQSVSQVPPAPGGRRRIYHGATVDFDFKDAPIHDLLRIIADTGHVNIVVPDTIDAKVTVRLKRVPWDEALDVILASHGLWYRREGNLYRIAPRKELDAEDEAEAARREAAQKAEAPRPEIVTLNYASADELRTKLEGMLSQKGKIEVDGRTNSLIINDVAGNREQIAKLAYQLDTQTPQITIEARIVEANSDYVRQIGVQWGGRASASPQGGNATGLIFPSSIAVQGANEDNQTKNFGVSLPSDFAVNLPAGTGSGEGGALGLSLGSIGGNFDINLRLSALEDVGTVRIISAPKITVLNNKQAEIRQGVSIPISVVSAAGTQTQFVQADLMLLVTPYVSQRDCAIAMNLQVTKNEPDFVNVGARGDPTIVRKEAKTTMLVNDGETTVLGGIYTRNSGLAYKKIPWLGDLPFIGWLFKNRRENDNRTEVLVFITPKITNKASLRCSQ
jgi:type IV pilus assembly protein PilQ